MMKGKILAVCIFVLLFTLIFCGCFEDNKKENQVLFLSVSQVLSNREKYINETITVRGFYISLYGNFSHLLVDESSVVYNESGEEEHLIDHRSAITISFIEGVDSGDLDEWKICDCTGILKKWDFPDDLGQYEIRSNLLLEVSQIRTYKT